MEQEKTLFLSTEAELSLISKKKEIFNRDASTESIHSP